jgi:poly-D-alanine transfer protein DltD
MSEQKQQGNRQQMQSAAEIFQSSEAISNREKVRKNINSHPQTNFSKTFEKTAEERGKTETEKAKWRAELRASGGHKRQVKM